MDQQNGDTSTGKVVALRKAHFTGFYKDGGGSVFVIAMPDKYEAVRASLESVGLAGEARFIKAVNAKDLDPHNLVDMGLLAPEFSARILEKPGVYGCHMSHMLAMDLFLQTAAPVALILEDDLVFPRGAETGAKEIRAAMEKTAKLAEAEPGKPLVSFLGYCYASGRGPELESAKGMHQLAEPRCTHAYMVNRAAAAAILAEGLPQREAVDEQIARMQQDGALEIVGSDTPIVNQDWPHEHFPAYKENEVLNASTAESAVLEGTGPMWVCIAAMAAGALLLLLAIGRRSALLAALGLALLAWGAWTHSSQR